MWSCDTCGRPNKSNPLICETCGAAAPGANPEDVALALRRDLTMEAHLRALAFWYRVGGALMLVFGLGLIGFTAWIGHAALGDASSWRGPGAMVAGAVGYMATLTAAAAIGSWVLGHFLARFANGARLAAGILTAIGLAFAAVRFVLTAVLYSRLADVGTFSELAPQPSLAGPIATLVLSTIWMIAILATLFSGRAAQVCAPAYRTLVARTAQMKAPMHKSVFFIVPLVGTILCVLVVMMLVIRMHSAMTMMY